jgi:hypothetical protein
MQVQVGLGLGSRVRTRLGILAWLVGADISRMGCPAGKTYSRIAKHRPPPIL